MVISPISILGDGASSVSQLILEKNKLRARNPWYSDRLIEVDEKLLKRMQSSEIELDDILDRGVEVFLETESGLEFGGETIAIGDVLHKDFWSKAAQAVSAIPGLEFACVHMLIPYPDLAPDEQRWAVAKIDTSPPVGMFHFPWRGEPCNIVENVVKNLCLTERTIWLRSD